MFDVAITGQDADFIHNLYYMAYNRVYKVMKLGGEKWCSTRYLGRSSSIPGYSGKPTKGTDVMTTAVPL